MTTEEAFSLTKCPDCGGTDLMKVAKTGLVSCLDYDCIWHIRVSPPKIKKGRKK